MDYNIEFAHIYADKSYGEEQANSIKALKKFLEKIKGKTYVTVVLIDDFNPGHAMAEEEEFLKKISSQVDLDFVAYEAGLVEVAIELLNHIDDIDKQGKVIMLRKDGIIGLTTNKGDPTCALLIVAWHLCRLGLMEVPKKVVKNFSEKTFTADKILTILPERYRSHKDRVLAIIKASKFKDHLDQIEYLFF